MAIVLREWKTGTGPDADVAAGITEWGTVMERADLGDLIRRHSDRWPDSESTWTGHQGDLAALMEDRLLRIIGDRPVIWADGGSEPVDGTDSLVVTVVTEAFVIMDAVQVPERGRASRIGATRVIPWSQLTGVTVRESWKADDAAQTVVASFVVHMGNGLDLEVNPTRSVGYLAASELLTLVLGKLAAKQ